MQDKFSHTIPRLMTKNKDLKTTEENEINRRRTFAIISHPDAGKTTLTEKFLLYGGAIQLAGQVRAKGESRRTRSDFMKMEQDRGISVSASAMLHVCSSIPNSEKAEIFPDYIEFSKEFCELPFNIVEDKAILNQSAGLGMVIHEDILSKLSTYRMDEKN